MEDDKLDKISRFPPEDNITFLILLLGMTLATVCLRLPMARFCPSANVLPTSTGDPCLSRTSWKTDLFVT